MNLAQFPFISERDIQFLDQNSFELMCHSILKHIVSPEVRLNKRRGRDAGRDASYHGSGYGQLSHLSGTWVFQLKYRDPTSFRESWPSILETELMKLLKRNQLPDVFVMITNLDISVHQKDSAFAKIIKYNDLARVQRLLIWDAKDVAAFANSTPIVAERFVPGNLLQRSGGDPRLIEDKLYSLDSMMTQCKDLDFRARLERQRERLLGLLRISMIEFEATSYLEAFSRDGDVFCLDTSLEKIGYQYWEQWEAFYLLLRNTLDIIPKHRIAPRHYQTIVTFRDAGSADVPSLKPLVRLAAMFAKAEAPISFVPSGELVREGLYRDFSVAGPRSAVEYRLPEWVGSRTISSRSACKEMMDLWHEVRSMRGLYTVDSSADLAGLREYFGLSGIDDAP